LSFNKESPEIINAAAIKIKTMFKIVGIAIKRSIAAMAK
jgi:hypothetical protein